MSQAKIQTRGRITIPAEVRAALGLEPGDELRLVQVRPGRYELRTDARPALLSARKADRLEIRPRPRGQQLKLPI